MPENPALIKGKTKLPTLNYVIRTVCLAVWALFCLYAILSVTQKMPTLSKHTSLRYLKAEVILNAKALVNGKSQFSAQ